MKIDKKTTVVVDLIKSSASEEDSFRKFFIRTLYFFNKKIQVIFPLDWVTLVKGNHLLDLSQ